MTAQRTTLRHLIATARATGHARTEHTGGWHAQTTPDGHVAFDYEGQPVGYVSPAGALTVYGQPAAHIKTGVNKIKASLDGR